MGDLHMFSMRSHTVHANYILLETSKLVPERSFNTIENKRNISDDKMI